MTFKMLATAVAVHLAVISQSVADDIAGSADHPLVGRFESSVISAYDYREFDEYSFADEAIKSNDPDTLKKVEGETTRIAYILVNPNPE